MKVVRVLAWLAVSLLAGAAAAAEIQIDFEADLGTEIAQGRFDPQRDTVGLRAPARPVGRRATMAALGAGRYGVRVARDVQACGASLATQIRIQRRAGWRCGLGPA
jgi:hypothetical protein